MTSQPRFSATAIEAALAQSVLAAFPPAVRATLTHDAVPADLPAGTTLYYEADAPRCGLVIAGLLRVYMTSPDGRQALAAQCPDAAGEWADRTVGGLVARARGDPPAL